MKDTPITEFIMPIWIILSSQRFSSSRNYFLILWHFLNSRAGFFEPGVNVADREEETIGPARSFRYLDIYFKFSIFYSLIRSRMFIELELVGS